MVNNTKDTQLLADTVVARRKRLGLRQRDIENASGVSIAVVRAIESAGRDRPQRKTLLGLERALGWPPGAAKAVLTAHEPPFPGSPITDLRVYAEELISGEFRPVDRLALGDTEAVRALPTAALVTQLIPLAVELARRFDVDLITPTGTNPTDHISP
ncbi:MAG TPA: helix-turn-helix domain-containing protein [Pseudonocardiaceae bacterium]|jgi:transcriptional regulator with XRE-family HTH domain|nr:helix-turn-helix domain-containing protein [Pseudonocardiaceae bacterium]